MNLGNHLQDRMALLKLKNLLFLKAMKLFQAAKHLNICVKKVNGLLKLKTNHHFLFKCHGSVSICKTEWIDLVVKKLNRYHMCILEIQLDENIWEYIVLPKLTLSYYSCILL